MLTERSGFSFLSSFVFALEKPFMIKKKKKLFYKYFQY